MDFRRQVFGGCLPSACVRRVVVLICASVTSSAGQSSRWAAPCVRLSARSFLGGVCLCLGALPAHRSRRAVFLAATALVLVMRTKGVLWWTALAEKNSWMPAAGLFVAWFPLVPIWWHGTRLVLSLCKSINLFFSVLELQTNWVLVKGARLNSGFAWVPVQILSPLLPSVIVG